MAFGDFTVVRSTVKNVLGSNGLLQEVAINTPAFEFNADGSYKGLLVEPAGTNLLLRSDDFDNGAWSKVSAPTVTPDFAVAPDGTTTATFFQRNSGSSLEQVINVTSGQGYSYSLFAKKSTVGNTIAIVLTGDGYSTNVSVVSYNFDTKVATITLGTATASVTQYPNGYARISIYSVASSTNSATVRITTGNDGDNAIIWQAQAETGSVATSPIYTTSGTVTRTADDISLSSASSLIGQNEGTIYMEIDWKAYTLTGLFPYLIQIGDGTDSNRILIYLDSFTSELRMYIDSNGVTQTNQGASLVGYSGIIKIAFGYKSNDAVLFKDGASISADNVVDLSALATLSDVYIGQTHLKTRQPNMNIRSVALFPTRLSNSQLATLTTL